MSTVASDRLITAEELLARSSELGRCELIRGKLVMRSPPGGRHGDLAFKIAFEIGLFVREHDLGKVYGEVGFLLERSPDTVRAPDAALIRKDRLAEADTARYIPIPPDLAVEVNSPNDVMGEVVEKVQWWLAHGVRLVWVVDPKSRTVTAYHPDGSARVHQHGQTLEGGDVLPGFTLPLATLFTH